jgi:hypothetical protein
METITARRSKCPSGIRAFNGDGNVQRLGCDQWKCDVCRKYLTWRCAKRVWLGVDAFDGDAYHQFLTLPGKIGSPAFGFWVLKRAWDNYRKSMQRSLGKWGYAAFVELHPRRTGIAHFHIISLAQCPERINDLAAHCGFGWSAHEGIVVGVGAAFEVSKYISKQGAAMPKGFRRVRLSQAWPRLPEPNSDLVVYAKAKKEGFDHYSHRVHALTSAEIPDLLARWEHSEYDV